MNNKFLNNTAQKINVYIYIYVIGHNVRNFETIDINTM